MRSIQKSIQPNNTLLRSIQKSLLSRKNDLGTVDDKQKNDGSLQILACPDVSREVEEVRELILDMVYGGQIGNFNDIAVYMPDTNKYLPHIQRVFGAYPQNHPNYIPFTVLGASCGASLTARALFALLDIIGGQFNRARIFELLRNPIVWESREFSPDDVEAWEEWAEECGMFRGYDRDQRRSMGDMGEAETDEHTFKRGMEKVLADINAIGNADASDDNENAAFAAFISADTATSDKKESAETFLSLLKELNDLSAHLTKNNGTLDIRESTQTLVNAVWLWLGNIPNVDSVDCAAEARVRRDALDGFGRILLQCEIAGRSSMPASEFIALARGCVPEETAVPSNAWNGVTFAPLRSATVLPHRVIFAIGLGASDFPGTSDGGNWDLLAGDMIVNGKKKRNRIVGDSDTVRDNRFAFLELIHAAKERLILSYRARDMQKDERLQPSSVIMELEEYLISQGLTHGKNGSRQSSVTREIPWVVYESLDKAVERGRGHGTWDKTLRELAILSSIPVKDRAKHRHDLSPRRHVSPLSSVTVGIDRQIVTDQPAINDQHIGTDQRTGTDQRIINDRHISTNQHSADVRDLKLFLKNPLEYHLRKTLLIKDERDCGDMSAVDEPVETSSRHLSILRRNVWTAALRAALSPNIDANELARIAVSEAENAYLKHIDSGQAPEGHICRMEKEFFIKWARSCATAAMELRAIFPNHRLAEKEPFSYHSDPFTVSGNLALAILPDNGGDKSLDIGVVAFGKKIAKGAKPGDNLELWIDGAMRWLDEMRSGAPRAVRLVLLDRGDDPKAKTSQMKMIPERLADMENWLMSGEIDSNGRPRGVLPQMLADNRCEHLPFEAVSGLGLGEGLTFEAFKDNLAAYKTSTKGFNLTDAKAEKMSDGELREIVISRYAPITERWLHE